MKILKIQGGHKLSGTVRISGAKNSAVALIPATLLADDKITLCNIPNILDIDNLEKTLIYLNVKVNRASESLVIDTTTMEIRKYLRNYLVN